MGIGPTRGQTIVWGVPRKKKPRLFFCCFVSATKSRKYAREGHTHTHTQTKREEQRRTFPTRAHTHTLIIRWPSLPETLLVSVRSTRTCINAHTHTHTSHTLSHLIGFSSLMEHVHECGCVSACVWLVYVCVKKCCDIRRPRGGNL